YDRRGHSRGGLHDGPVDTPVALHADDAAAILAAVTDEPAYVYGSSAGGTIGLELVARDWDLVWTLVAHQPPVVELLPDAAAWRARGVFPGDELARIGAYVPDLDALRNVSTRIVSAAGETSGVRAGRRAAVALADRLGIEVTYLPGARGGSGSDPHEF